MPRNGSGTYTLPPGINPVVTQTLITSNWANTTMQDIANALTQSLAKDGQTLPTANLPLGGFRFTGGGDPQGPQDFMTLSFAQKGQQTRITNVAGINDITGNLPGGLATFSVGQLAQLVPFATNTGPVTISINGSPPASILSATGGPLAATNLQAGQVYLLSWNGTAWNILTSPDITGWVQAAITGWDRPTSGTYPPVTQVNANTIAIPAGAGRIVKPSTRDITGVTEVSWATQNYVLQNITNAWETTIGINAAGQVVEFNGNVNAAWARSAILLCTVGHVNGTIQFISNKPLIFGDVAYMAYDLGILFHNTLIKGGRMSGNVGNPLHLDISAGTLWIVGGAANSSDSPNYLNFPNMPNINFWPVTANNTVGAVTQTVPVGFYDPAGAGAVVAIPGGGATSVIHRLWLLAGQIIFTYGQIAYANLDTAVAALDSDNTFFVPPPKLADATLIGYIIARKDTVNLNDFAFARLLSAADAGGASGGGGGGGVPEAPINGQTYGRNNGAWVTAVDTVQAGANVTVNAGNPNKPIVAVPSSNLVQGAGVVLSGTATNRLVGAGGNLTVTGTDTFRNKLINAGFIYAQRGNGKTYNNSEFAYLIDRWAVTTIDAGTSATFDQVAFPFGQTEVPDNPFLHAQVNVLANAATNGAAVFMEQKIENVQTLANGPVAVSFWARAQFAGRPISVELEQNFGVGGSPPIFGFGATKFVLTGAWQKYQFTANLPSVAGKIAGASNSLRLLFWMSAGADYAARTLNLGPQLGIVQIAQVQLEYGTIPTPFEQIDLAVQLVQCQRFYEKSYPGFAAPGSITGVGASAFILAGLNAGGHIPSISVDYKVEKRVVVGPALYSPDTGAVGFMRDQVASADVAAFNAFTGTNGFTCRPAGSLAASTDVIVAVQWTADAEIPNV